MDKNPDPKLGPPLPSVDETRRRLTKAGLAAPAVLGALASRPVLGQSLHNCTPSGHISGFASVNPDATDCSLLGYSPDHYAAGPSTWPTGAYFINDNGGVRLFKNAPRGGVGVTFADAYQRRRLDNNEIRDANVWDVVAGCVINQDTGGCRAAWVLEARAAFDSNLTLGREAVAACMNAINGYPQSFPISPKGVVDMFNNVVVGGLDPVTETADWSAAEVIAYFQSLHG